MKLRVLYISVLLLQFLIVTAQSGSRSVRQTDILQDLKDKEAEGQVTIYLDSLLEVNYNKLLLQNSKTSGVSGYRIRIFSDNGRGAKDNQKKARANFLSLYPEIDAYSRYEGSYYKIYVGDFRTKNEAILLLRRIDKNFPDAFVVEDKIKIEE